MKPIYSFLLFLSLVFFSTTACKKDSYLTDGGVHNAHTSYTTYDYLAANQYHYFDTVLQIIDHFNLKDTVNKAGTFFAPTDYAVNRLMITLASPDLETLYSHISSRFITQYMFSDTAITLDNANTTPVMYTNWADTIAGVQKTAYSYGAVTSTFTYYVLQYVKINGYPDGSSGAPSDDPTDYVMNCQTTGILTSSGTTLHVLSNAASLAGR